MTRLGFIGRAPASYDDEFMGRMAGAYLRQTPWSRLRLAAVRDLVEPRPGDRVLDLGSAGGAVTHYVTTFGADAVGVDSEPRAVETASRLFPELRFELADVTDLPFPDGSFDKAVAADLVEHLTDGDLAQMLVEVARVLVPCGSLSIYTPNAAHPIEVLKERDLVLARNETHVGLRTNEQLVAALRRAGYAVERDDWRPSHFPILQLAERIGGGRVPALRYRLCVRARSGSDEASPADEPATERGAQREDGGGAERKGGPGAGPAR